MADVTSTPMRGLRPIERALLSTASMIAFERFSSRLPVMAVQLVAVLRVIDGMNDGDQNVIMFGPLSAVQVCSADLLKTFNAVKTPEVEARLRDRCDAIVRLRDALGTFFARRAAMDLQAAGVVVATRDMVAAPVLPETAVSNG